MSACAPVCRSTKMQWYKRQKIRLSEPLAGPNRALFTYFTVLIKFCFFLDFLVLLLNGQNLSSKHLSTQRRQASNLSLQIIMMPVRLPMYFLWFCIIESHSTSRASKRSRHFGILTSNSILSQYTFLSKKKNWYWSRVFPQIYSLTQTNLMRWSQPFFTIPCTKRCWLNTTCLRSTIAYITCSTTKLF